MNPTNVAIKVLRFGGGGEGTLVSRLGDVARAALEEGGRSHDLHAVSLPQAVASLGNLAARLCAELGCVNVETRLQLERARQEQLKKEGRFEQTAADDVSDFEKLAVLVEEVSEVELASDPVDRKVELIQVAAVCVAWIESMMEV